MRKIYLILFLLMMCCVGCEWQLKGDDTVDDEVTVSRYDRIQSLYLTTGDFSALQQMNTTYPMQTRTLIEDVLRIGKVDDLQINTKFLRFYQDSTLQQLISEAERQYADMEDINRQLTEAFHYLLRHIPDLPLPEVYAQIGSLDQSVIVGNGQIGICLDKYLGADYALYQRPEYGYSEEQLSMMQRSYIVPDCIGFYLLSLFPRPIDRELSQSDRDTHMGKIQWVVNKAIGHDLFQNIHVDRVEEYLRIHKNTTLVQLLKNTRYSDFL